MKLFLLLNNSVVISADYNDSDRDDSSESSKKWGGSPLFKAPNILRYFEVAYNMLVNHYVNGTDSLYNESTFEQCFSVPRVVASRIFYEVNGIDPFIDKENVCTED